MSHIALLAPELVNRIAAGECVERPASVVKELVENALDAGATRIEIIIRDGGRELIQTIDDGAGMDLADLTLCVQSHATSKIRTDEDLFKIQTMGFRGEALPSIGSVSRLTITSRTRVSEIAHTIRVEGGSAADATPTGAPAGTNIEVRDLFYNVPARRKFLKTNQTEMGHISEQLARVALAHPQVAFSLKHGARVSHQLPATPERLQRIADFYGPELAEVLLPIERAGRGVRIEGWVAPPKETRGSGKWEYLFVNGRYVRDKFVSHAIKAAYRSLIDPSRYPVAFLFIEIDPAQIDVNVHPTKIEIRWRDSNYIHSQVLAALRDKFLATNLDHTLEAGPDAETYRAGVRQAMVDFFVGAKGSKGQGFEGRREQGTGNREPGRGNREQGTGNREQGTGNREQGTGNREQGTGNREQGTGNREQGTGNREQGTGNREQEYGNRNLLEERKETEAPPAVPTFARSHVPTRDAVPTFPRSHVPTPPKALQVHNAYLIVETDDGLMIIDQHALHERILYEQLKSRIAQRPLEAQRLLLPDVVSVPADRIEALETHADLLARLGVELTPSGPQSVTLHAFPSLLERVHRERFVHDLLDLLSEQGAHPDPEMLIHDLLDMMACKAAVKFGDPLTPDEIEALLARREAADRSSHCPHGRPTTLHLTLRDLERQFKRR